MIDEFITDGEKLYCYINNVNKKNFDWTKFSLSHCYTGRSEQFVELFSEIITVNTVCKLVSVGRSINKRHTVNSDIFDKEFIKYMRDNMEVRQNEIDQFFRLCKAAVRASLESINDKTRRNLTEWSKRKHCYCYMCNVDLNYYNDNIYNSFTLEHIWPQSYGGNSLENNLLPACRSCNSNKKKDFATWAMPSIQSMMYGLIDSEGAFDSMDGSYKFALHYKHAQEYSRKNRISLKRSFEFIGPWTEPQIIDNSDVADFFNIKIIKEMAYAKL